MSFGTKVRTLIMTPVGNRRTLRLPVGVFWLVLLAAAPALGQQGHAKETPQSPASPSPTPSASPTTTAELSLTDIASGLDDLQRLLPEVTRRSTNDSERLRIENTIIALGSELETKARQADQVLSSLPSVHEVQDLDTEWRVSESSITGMERTLVTRASALRDDISWLNGQEEKWNKILTQIQPDASLAELQSRIRQSLGAVQTTRTLAEDELKFTVTLQTRLSEQERFIRSVRDRIIEERTQIQKGLFQADSRPLWDFEARRQTDQALQRVLRRHFARDWSRLREFAAAHQKTLLFAALFALLTLFGIIKARRLLPAWIESNVVDSRYVHFFRRPYSMAAFAGLMSILPLLPGAPSAARGVLSVLFVVPLVRLLGPLMQPEGLKLLYSLIVSLLLIQGSQMTTASAFVKRDLLALLSLISAGVLIFISHGMRKRGDASGFRRKICLLGIRVGIVFLLVSFAANLFGYFALSQLLNDAALFGAYHAVVIYTAGKIIQTIALTLLRTETASRSAVVRGHHPTIRRWLVVLIALGAIVAWFFSFLRILTIQDVLVDKVKAVLSTPIVSGESSFTGNDVVTFLLVMAIGIVTATVLRIVLREDVLQRLPVRHGVPYAVSMLTYYVLLLFIFVMALLAAGVELSKFTLFTGAFGIGVGFGLQNAINNFASGLILLFERPIRERDILEVDGAFGEVTRIGMRSTSIRTAEEAEVILPNSNLVAGKVINWSRLGHRRPIELPIRAAYGTDPKVVIKLLIETAAAHPDVLSDPVPTGFLQKFGDKALEFTLVFWVGRYHLHRRVLSDVAISVTEAFKNAGIQVPVSDKDSRAKSASSEDSAAFHT